MKLKPALVLLFLVFSACTSSIPETTVTVKEEAVELVPAAETKAVIDTFGFTYALPVTWTQKNSENESRYLMAVGSPTTTQDGTLMDLNYLDVQVWFNDDYSDMDTDQLYDFFDMVANDYSESRLKGKVEWTTERTTFAGEPALILTYQTSNGDIEVERKLYHFVHNGYLFMMEASKSIQYKGSEVDALDPVGAQELDALLASFKML